MAAYLDRSGGRACGPVIRAGPVKDTGRRGTLPTAPLVRAQATARPRPGRAGARSVRCSAWAAPPAGDAAVVAAAQHLGHAPAAERRGPGVLRLLEQPAGAEALGHRALVVAHRARQQPGDRLDHQACGHLAAREHDVADAQLAVDEVLADPVVDPLVAAAQQAEPVAGGQLARPAPGRTGARPGRAGTAGAAGRRPRPRRRSARAVITMPAPPPNGASSTVRWTSVVWSRMSWQRRSSSPVVARLAEQAGRAERVDDAGEDREDVDPHGAVAFVVVEQPLRRVDDDDAVGVAARRTPPARARRTRARAGRRPGWRPPATHRAAGRPVDLDDLGPDQLVHPQLVGVVDRLGVDGTLV